MSSTIHCLHNSLSPHKLQVNYISLKILTKVMITVELAASTVTFCGLDEGTKTPNQKHQR